MLHLTEPLESNFVGYVDRVIRPYHSLLTFGLSSVFCPSILHFPLVVLLYNCYVILGCSYKRTAFSYIAWGNLNVSETHFACAPVNIDSTILPWMSESIFTNNRKAKLATGHSQSKTHIRTTIHVKMLLESTTNETETEKGSREESDLFQNQTVP